MFCAYKKPLNKVNFKNMLQNISTLLTLSAQKRHGDVTSGFSVERFEIGTWFENPGLWPAFEEYFTRGRASDESQSFWIDELRRNNNNIVTWNDPDILDKRAIKPGAEETPQSSL